MYPSESAFASAYGLQQVPTNNGTGDPGWSGPNPNGQGDVFVGADGQLYSTSSIGQEKPGTPSQGNYQDWAKNNPAPGATLPPSLISALAQPAYNQAPAQQNPTYAPNTQLGTSNVDPGLLRALSPQASENLLVQGFQPEAQRSERNLNQTLADAGIVGGPAVQAQDELQTSLAQALAPSLASLVSGSQSNLLGAAGTGSGMQQQTGLSNAATGNQANAYNVGEVNATNQGNTATYNTQQQQLMQMLAQMYSQQSGQNANAINQGQSGSNAIATGSAQNFQVPSQGTGGLTAALGQNYAAQSLAGKGASPAATPTLSGLPPVTG